MYFSIVQTVNLIKRPIKTIAQYRVIIKVIPYNFVPDAFWQVLSHLEHHRRIRVANALQYNNKTMSWKESVYESCNLVANIKPQDE